MKVRKTRLLGTLVLALVLPFALPLTSSAQDVKLLGVVAVPRHTRPVTSWNGRVEISWPEPATPMITLSPQPR